MKRKEWCARDANPPDTLCLEDRLSACGVPKHRGPLLNRHTFKIPWTSSHKGFEALVPGAWGPRAGWGVGGGGCGVGGVGGLFRGGLSGFYRVAKRKERNRKLTRVW